VTDLNSIESELKTECREDHVGLWAIISSVRDRFESITDSETRRVVIDIIRNLLTSDRIGAGQFTRDGDEMVFEFWSLSPDEAVDRIGREWDALGRDPIPGEVVWLTSLENGGALPRRMTHES
jgi:hypothetical protein